MVNRWSRTYICSGCGESVDLLVPAKPVRCLCGNSRFRRGTGYRGYPKRLGSRA